MVVYLGSATPASGSGGGSGAAVWGAITGTLANQTDLQNALNEKQASLSSDQITATNSGITSALVTQIGTNESAISTINGKIPSAASTENQLADKSFVNSSIATNTANFIGTYENVATLEAYTGTVTNNDYAFVINSVVKDNGSDWATFADLDAYSKAQLTNFDYAWVINGAKFDLYRFDVINQTWELRVANTDKASVTLNTAYNRYKATVENSTVTWDYEYTLNNSSFTAVQWAAINSGANTTNIGQIATNTTNIGTLQTQAGNAVLTTTAQTLSGAINELDAAMPAAQVNADWTAVSGVSAILNKPNLAAVATSGSYSDLSNTPTIPTVNNATLTITQDGTTVGTFTANASSDTTIALTSGSGLQNTATGDYSLTILGTGASAGDDINIGTGSYTASGEYPFSGGNVVIGNNAYSNGDINSSKNNNVVIGKSAYAYGGDNVVIGESARVINDGNSHNNNVVIGHNASASQNFSIAIGNGSRATGWESIQIGTFNCENAEDNTLYVGFSNANYKMLDSAGKIPNARLDTANLSVGSVENKNTASGSVSPLALWHGTQAQWEQGAVDKTWYNWENFGWNNSTLPDTIPNNRKLVYGENGNFVIVNSRNKIIYSLDDGLTWNETNSSIPDAYLSSPAYGNGRFIIACNDSNQALYSDDGGVTWDSLTLPSRGNWGNVCYGNGTFVIAGGNGNRSDKVLYSTDNGETWATSSLFSGKSWDNLAYYNETFFLFDRDSTNEIYSTDNAQTWQSTNLSTVSGNAIKFIYCGGNDFAALSGVLAKGDYSSDGGKTWSASTLTADSSIPFPANVNGKLVSVGGDSVVRISTDKGKNWTNISPSDSGLATLGFYSRTLYDGKKLITVGASKVAYSFDEGETWINSTLPASSSGNSPFCFVLGNENSVAIRNNSNEAIVLSTESEVYTLDQNPTTASTVYSAPDTTSALTITSVDTDTITLSDTNTYYYNSSGNQFSYLSVGEVNPNYLCFIDGVGVKIGTTFIADYSAPAIGDIDTALTAIIAQGS